MLKRIYFLIIFSIVATLLSGYGIGDQVSNSDQNLSLDVCAGDYPFNQLRLADFNGALNGGNYHILFIDNSASW